MFKSVVELMYFVPDRHQAAQWYARLFETKITYLDAIPEAFFIQAGPHQIWFHTADSKVAAGAAGLVAYWQVGDFDATLARAQQLGGQLYRGPLYREEDQQYMCQVRDPFGNLIGLVGPRTNPDSKRE